MGRLWDGCCYIVGCCGEGSLEYSRVVLGILRGNRGSSGGGRGAAFRGYWENPGDIRESQHVSLSEDNQGGTGIAEGCWGARGCPEGCPGCHHHTQRCPHGIRQVCWGPQGVTIVSLGCHSGVPGN